mmetsp:Transcript_4870/g.10009  ORF Transcript_4870/g.10009 Transcript_4870/m.10009 type:complete len:190 (+) Transcript_4870:460-1029(+)
MTSVSSSLALDCVITNAIVLDAMLGVVKADTGIKGNRIHNIGKAGNPDFMNGVTLDPGREMIVGPTTDVIAGEKLIVTAGGGRHPHPVHLSPAMRRGHRQRHHHAVRGRHRTQRRDVGHHLHARTFPRRNDAAGHGRPAPQFRIQREGQHERSERLRHRRVEELGERVQIARGFGYDSLGDRSVFDFGG